MPSLTDPLDALLSLQRAFQSRSLVMRPGELDPSVRVHVDQPKGELRLTYARLEGSKVAAIAILTPGEPIEPGVRCFGIGYAVHRDYRGQGRAKALVVAAIAEFRNGMARNGMSTFHIEAIVGVDNVASQHVAAATISPEFKTGIDDLSGEPILQYVRKVQATS